MAREYTVTRTAYTWDELSEDARDTARQNYSTFLWDCGAAQESCKMIFEDMTTEAGWVNVSGLTFSLYCQGGMPTWSGNIEEFDHGGRTYYVAVRDHHYYGPSIYIDPGEDDMTKEEETAVREAVRDHIADLSYRMYHAFIAEDKYQTSDEMMRETSEANGYEYDDAGNLI